MDNTKEKLYCTDWDDSLDYLTIDELTNLLSCINKKVELVVSKLMWTLRINKSTSNKNSLTGSMKVFETIFKELQSRKELVELRLAKDK